MKKSAFLLAVFATAMAFAAALTPDETIKNRDKHDGKTIAVAGVATEVKERTSQRGNKYTTFKIKGAKESVSVWLGGHLEAKEKPGDGDKVEVTGVFRKEKKVGELSFKNELDASKKRDQPNGVKIVERKK